MKVVADSSAFAKRFVEEAGSEHLQSILQDTTQLAFSSIVVPEIISSLRRKVRENQISDSEYKKIKHLFLEDIKNATILQVTPNLISLTIEILEQNTVRTLDTIHIASAVIWQADLFVTSDKRQLQAAKKSKRNTTFIG